MTDRGLFDLCSPALSAIDGFLADSLALAPVWRIAFFAALGSVGSMLLFKRLSNQTELAALKRQTSAVQQALARAETEVAGLGQLIRQNLALSGRRLWLSFWPALAASVPVLFLLTFCSTQFGFQASDPGSRVYVTPAEFDISPSQFEWRGVNAQWDARKAAWTFYQPESGQHATLALDGRAQVVLPTAVPASVIHKKRWWNFFFANPAGYLDEGAQIGLFMIDAPPQIIIDWGPGWMRGWAFAFLSFLVLFSIISKIVWKIH